MTRQSRTGGGGAFRVSWRLRRFPGGGGVHFAGGQIDPEEILICFFQEALGQAMRRGARGQHFFHQSGPGHSRVSRGQARANRQEEGAGGLAGLFRFYILVVILMSLSSFGSSPNYGPQYSIRKTSMNVRANDRNEPNVMPGIPFYVSTDLNYRKGATGCLFVTCTK